LCYNTLDLAPLYYRKGAHEGSRYTVDEVFYSYPGGKTQVKQHRQRHDGRHTWETHVYDDCVVRHDEHLPACPLVQPHGLEERA
jgi:hypothetical protein